MVDAPQIELPAGFGARGDPVEFTLEPLVPEINHLIRVAYWLYGGGTDRPGPAAPAAWPEISKSPLLGQAMELDERIRSAESVSPLTRNIPAVQAAVAKLLSVDDDFISDNAQKTIDMERRWIDFRDKNLGSAVNGVTIRLAAYHDAVEAKDQTATNALNSMQQTVALAESERS